MKQIKIFSVSKKGGAEAPLAPPPSYVWLEKYDLVEQGKFFNHNVIFFKSGTVLIMGILGSRKHQFQKLSQKQLEVSHLYCQRLLCNKIQ